MAVTFLSRATWGANPLTVQLGFQVPTSQIVGLVVHHTVIVMPDYDHDGMNPGDVDDACTYMRQLQRARPDLGNEVPYSFVVFAGATPDSCIVAEGRGIGRTGAHTIGYNSTRYGVAFAGDFTAVAPTSGMWAGVRYVGHMLYDPIHAYATIGHRDVYATACPGDDAYPHLDQAQPPFTDPIPAPPAPKDKQLITLTSYQSDDHPETLAVRLINNTVQTKNFVDDPKGKWYPVPSSTWHAEWGAPITVAASFRHDGTLDINVETDKGVVAAIGRPAGKPFDPWYTI